MSKHLYQQQLKTLLLQLLVGAISASVLLTVTQAPIMASAYSVLTGLVYTALLALSINACNRFSVANPQLGMAALASLALLRFVVIGIMFIYAMSQWGEYPINLVLPFILMLIAPFFLIANKRRLTD